MRSLSEIIEAQPKSIRSELLNRTDSSLITLCGLLESSLNDLKSKSRDQDLVIKRALIYQHYRKKGYSLKRIGAMFNRNHATVLHSLGKLANYEQVKDAYFVDMKSRFTAKMQNEAAQNMSIYFINDFE